jgi:hypothetical protein
MRGNKDPHILYCLSVLLHVCNVCMHLRAYMCSTTVNDLCVSIYAHICAGVCVANTHTHTHLYNSLQM